MEKLMLAFAVAAANVCAIFATDYNWSAAQDGDFEDVAKWTVGDAAATAVPGIDDRAMLTAQGKYTISFQNDATIGGVVLNRCWASPTADDIVFDLGGHTLTITNYLALIGRQQNAHNGSYETTETALTFQNGIFKFLTPYSWKSGSPWTIEGCLTGGLSINPGANTKSNREKLTIKGANTVVDLVGRFYAGSTRLNFNLLDGACFSNSIYGISGDLQHHVVSGENTKCVVRDMIHIASSGGTFEVKDGARFITGGCRFIDGNTMYNGWSFFVDNAFLSTTNSSTLTGEYDPEKESFCFRGGFDNLLCVTNNGRMWLRNLTINDAQDITVKIVDGGEISASGAVSLGQSTGTRTVLELDNGKLMVTGVVAYATSKGGSSNGVLRIKGPKSCLITHGNGFTYFDKRENGSDIQVGNSGLGIRFGVRVEFTIPEDGFEQVPIQVTQGKVFANCKADNPNRLIIDAQEWAVKHPKETITLIHANMDSKSALQGLVDNAEFIGGNASKRCVLNISEDGKILSLTSPTPVGTMMIVR